MARKQRHRPVQQIHELGSLQLELQVTATREQIVSVQRQRVLT
jgi:hypothetical protein